MEKRARKTASQSVSPDRGMVSWNEERKRTRVAGGGRGRWRRMITEREGGGKGERMRYADREVRERGGKSGTDAKNGRDGEGGRKSTRVEEKKSEEKLEGEQERENTRSW